MAHLIGNRIRKLEKRCFGGCKPCLLTLWNVAAVTMSTFYINVNAVGLCFHKYILINIWCLLKIFLELREERIDTGKKRSYEYREKWTTIKEKKKKHGYCQPFWLCSLFTLTLFSNLHLHKKSIVFINIKFYFNPIE